MLDVEKKIPFKKLWMPGLKPSDYYLYNSMQKYFDLNMRQLFVLALRLIYAGATHPEFREWILRFAAEVKAEDLDRQLEGVEYQDIAKRMTLPL